MECTIPPPLSDEDLSLALDGMASQSVLDHLAQCEGCAARLEEARQFELSLKARLFRIECPKPDELGDYQLARISGERIQAIEAHLTRCPHCRSELEEIRTFLREEIASPPTRRPVPRRVENDRRPSRNWLQTLATLLPPVPQAVLRGASNERIIRAQTEDGTMVRLAAHVEDDRVVVQGQILGDPAVWVGALVEVRQADHLRVITTVLESGQFRFELASTDDLIRLKISSATGSMIVVNNVSLKNEA